MKATIGIALCGCVLAVACKKKEQPEMNATPGQPGAMGTGGNMGSAMTGKDMGGSGSAGGGSGSGSAVKPKTPDELAARYDECWGYFNAGKLEELKTCLAPDVVVAAPGLGTPEVKGADAVVADAQQQRTAMPDQHGEPQLVLVSGHDVFTVILLTGTDAATKKKTGVYVAQVLVVDDGGHIVSESDFFDAATIEGQLGKSKQPARPAPDKGWGPKTVALAKSDDKEKANLATFDKVTDAFNKHDAKAVLDLLADDAVWSEQSQPKDWDKKTAAANLPVLLKMFSDLKFTTKQSWAAGDYVAAVQTFEGTQNGKHATQPIAVLYRLDAGKVKQAWVFSQSQNLVAQLK